MKLAGVMIVGLLLLLVGQTPASSEGTRDFDGADDTMTMNGGLTQACTNSFGAYIWINADSEGENSNGRMFAFGGTGGYWLFDFRAPTAGVNEAEGFVDYGVTKVPRLGSNSITLNTWQFFGLEHSGTCTTGDNNCLKRVDDTSIAGSCASGDTGSGTSTSGTITFGNSSTVAYDGEEGYFHWYTSGFISDKEKYEIKYNPCFPIVQTITACIPVLGDATEVDWSGNGHTMSVSGATASNNSPPIFLGGGMPL